MNVMELMATLGIDTSEFNKGLKQAVTDAKGMGDEVTRHTGTASVALGNLISGLTEAATKFVMHLPGAAVDAAADVRAEAEAFEATFGELADAASFSIGGISEELNIFDKRLQNVATSGFAQFMNAGFKSVDALSSTERLLRLAADGAAFYDIALEDASDKMRSFLRGNVEAGESIGIFTNATQRDADALEMYGEKWAKLTEAQREMLLLDTVEKLYEQSGVIGQAARESDNWQNVTSNAAEAWRQMQAVIGGPLMEAFIPAAEKFTAWLTKEETVSSLSTFAEKVGDLSNVAMDGVITAFDWLSQNGEMVGTAMEAIGIGLAAAVAAAHPLAASLAAVVALLSQISGGHDYNQEFFGGYSEEELQTLQRYVDAWNKLSDAELQANVYQTADAIMAYTQAQQEFNAASAAAGEVDGLLADYHSWLGSQGHTSDQPYLDVPINAVLSEDSEGNLQSEVDGMNLEGDAALYADPNSKGNIQGWLDTQSFSAKVDLIPTGGGGASRDKGRTASSRAVGLDNVPYNNFLAALHEGEAVLTKTEAERWRRGEAPAGSSKRAGGDTINVPVTVYGTADSEEIASVVKTVLDNYFWMG